MRYSHCILLQEKKKLFSMSYYCYEENPFFIFLLEDYNGFRAGNRLLLQNEDRALVLCAIGKARPETKDPAVLQAIESKKKEIWKHQEIIYI